MSAWVRGKLLWKGRIFKKKSEIPHNDLTKPNIEGQVWVGTMEKHWEGILGFWRFGGATNAAMEGFNNKVRTMLRQAYGYRDDEYMILKIYDLPNRKLQVVI